MRIVAAMFGAATLLALASGGGNAQEMVAEPLGLATGSIEASNVAFGCGPGFIPNRFGVCRPRFYGRPFGFRGIYGRPYGYGYGYRPYGYRRFGYY